MLSKHTKNENFDHLVKNTVISWRDIPRAAILGIKKYGWMVFFYKVKDYIRIIVRKRTGIYLFDSIKKQKMTVSQLIWHRFTNLQSLKRVNVHRDEYRINIVTDSLMKSSLFGGVATALILVTLFSRKYNIPLRIITRETKNNPKDYENFLNLMQLKKPDKVEFYSDHDRNLPNNHYKLETSDKDIFVATSWWSAEAIKSVNLRKNYFYILQEIEKFFYPNGDEQYLCENVLHDQEIKFIINSKLLYDYYLLNKYDNIVNQGIYFEPAFPKHIYYPGKNTFGSKTKYKLLFYARPKNPRNLFYTGLKILDNAFQSGIINKAEWEIYFAGSDIPQITFSNGARPVILGQLDWSEYSNFLKEVDLGFCLMYTPHPSYPPLDIAASGGVVLTNKYANKQQLDYSQNIICEDLETSAMLDGFERAVNLAKNSQKRQQNFASNKIERDWGKTSEGILEFMDNNK